MPTDTKSRELAHDRLAAQFDALMNEYDVNRRLEVLIGEFLTAEDLTNQLVLEAGCGTGRGTRRLSQRSARVVSLDIGLNLVRYTRDHYPCMPIVGSVLALPYASNTFTVVFSTEVIEHTPDPLAAVREMYRVLKPGGHLVLSTPGWLWQWPVWLASALRLRPYGGLENFVRQAHLRTTLEAAGGVILEHRGIHLLPFQFAFLHPFLRYMDRYGRFLLPLMINQCIHCVKPMS